MTADEISKMVYIVKSTYPNQFKNYDTAMMKNHIAAWVMVFEDKPKDLAYQALKLYLSTDSKGFAPSPGQIVDCMHKIRPKQYMNEFEAWSLVDRAVKNSIYNANEEFNHLPQIIRRVVRNPARLREWAKMDIESYQTVEQSNFMRSYRVELQREKDREKIPEHIRPMIEEICDRLPQIEAKQETEQGTTPDEMIENLITQLGNL